MSITVEGQIPAWITVLWLAFTFLYPFCWRVTFETTYWKAFFSMLGVQGGVLIFLSVLTNVFILLGVGS